MNRPDDLFHRHHLRRSPGFFAVPCLITFYSVETEEEDWSVGPGANLEFMACGLACCSQCDTTGVRPTGKPTVTAQCLLALNSVYGEDG